MTHVFVDVKLTNPLARQQTVFVPDASVDTGATFNTVPQAVAEKLKLESFRLAKVRTATGDEEFEEPIVLIEVENEMTVNPVWIDPKIDRVLIGALTLEGLGFKVEPKTGKLEKSELLLFSLR